VVRRAAVATCLIVVLGCGVREREPHTPPDGLRSVRFEEGEAPRFRILADTMNETCDPASVSVAEDAEALRKNFIFARRRRLPLVDFSREIVVTFQLRSVCGQSPLEGFILTSHGELIPDFSRAWVFCEKTSEGCTPGRALAVALERAPFRKGTYVFRSGTKPYATFELRTESPVAERAGERAGAPQQSYDEPLPRHPRRARVVSEDGEVSYGIWVGEDAAWQPARPADLEPLDVQKPRWVCNLAACARVLGRFPCEPPECPGRGDLVLCDLPVGTRGVWPHERGSLARLLRELAADPVLEELLRAP
jgi:hypothetical protein